MTGGVLAFCGGGAFSANDELDRSLLAEADVSRIVMLPTADAFEGPGELIASAMSWGERLDVEVEALMVLHRNDADDEGAAGVVAGAGAVYLAGDSSMHLRSTLKDTAVFDALVSVLDQGGLVVAVGAAAAALCDPMLDQRGGAFTLGLGLVTGAAVIPEVESWSDERLNRTRSLADTTLIELPTGGAAVRRSGEWELLGGAVVSVGTLT